MRATRILGGLLSICLFSLFVGIFIRSRSSNTTGHLDAVLAHRAGAYTNVAYATFLGDNLSLGTSPTANGALANPSLEDLEDGYFLGVRVLAYSLLHDPLTRTNNSIPFIVLVTTDVSEGKRERLRADGATVIVIKNINAEWIRPVVSRYRDQLSKLHLFRLTEYRKICFMDADTLVTDQLDGIFKDPATEPRHIVEDIAAVRNDEPPIPRSYVFAGKGDAFKYDHAIPPEPSDYLNGGFFVIMPSQELFEYYNSLTRVPERFDSSFPDQNLFNYAHRKNGIMPWKIIDWKWNANWPTVRDYEKGVKSFHAKYWDSDPTHDEFLKQKWQIQRDRMRAYYAATTS